MAVVAISFRHCLSAACSIPNKHVPSLLHRLYRTRSRDSNAYPAPLHRLAGAYAAALIVGAVLLFPLVQAVAQVAPQDTTGMSNRPSVDDDIRAATQGSVADQLALAKRYNDGSYGRRDYGQAFKWFQLATNNGSQEARAWLGSLYLLGHGVSPNLEVASALIQEAAQSKDAVGLRFLGFMYETGRGVAEDYSRARSLYLEAAAGGNAAAYDDLGRLYFQGLGVRRSRAQAFTFFGTGARLGDAWAQLHLGQMYQSGPPSSSPSAAQASRANQAGGNLPSRSAPDYASAIEWYRASDAQGNWIAPFKLGTLYELGTGVPQSYDLAVSYYHRSARHRYGPGLLALGRCYELGLGVPADMVRAYVLYSLAEDQGQSSALLRLQHIMAAMSPDQIAQAKARLEERLKYFQ